MRSHVIANKIVAAKFRRDKTEKENEFTKWCCSDKI
jgi:hypothetical protein